MSLLNLARHQKLLLVAAITTALMSGCNSDDDDTQPTPPAAQRPKNVILMISDGASYGTWEMAAHWQGAENANDLAIYSDMQTRLGVTTYPLNTSNTPTNEDTSTLGYDPAAAWNTTVGEGVEKDGFMTYIEGYKYLKNNYTDSAAAGTALASGQKTYNNAINYDNHGKPMGYITQLAKAQGKATGVVSSVQMAHATPATFSAQNISRRNMHEIARDQLTNGNVDLLMGTGHPDYDGSGTNLNALSAEDCAANWACGNRFDSIGETEWLALKAGLLTPTGASKPWTLIEDKGAFELLASGNLSVDGPLVGIPRVRWTLQQTRSGDVVGADANQPSGKKMIATVPDLATMTQGALNYLGKDEDGLFLMVEGGAVDWAAHGNDTGTLIEEQLDFDRAVAVVKDWVEANSSWEETLLIVTTDHGNALPLAPTSDVTAFAPVVSNGSELLPEVRYWSGQHTNEVVRLWAIGAGSDKFDDYIRGTDSGFVTFTGHNSDGRYIDLTDVFAVMRDNIQPE
ncbi:MAG: alkaline phosphatase [Gammaproteobacteria bacterium]|nr:alkaline phosphatase [Gammaproteobacteria bacterium]